jgi:hypothetical protein
LACRGAIISGINGGAIMKKHQDKLEIHKDNNKKKT